MSEGLIFGDFPNYFTKYICFSLHMLCFAFAPTEFSDSKLTWRDFEASG